MRHNNKAKSTSKGQFLEIFKNKYQQSAIVLHLIYYRRGFGFGFGFGFSFNFKEWFASEIKVR